MPARSLPRSARHWRFCVAPPQASNAGAEEASGAAVDYLRLFALVAMGWMWARMAAVPGDTPQHQASVPSPSSMFAASCPGRRSGGALCRVGVAVPLPAEAF
jgi:hypothetical protein